MKALITIDSFKGSLSTFQSGEAAKEGILRVFPEAEVIIAPLADGGEGTVSAITSATGGEIRRALVHDPLGREVVAEYGSLPDGTAVIEMAAASGITLVSGRERNPLYTSTFGTGELIRLAILDGCRKFIIGIGGSATNDGGAGMLEALGFELLDEHGKRIPRGAIGLSQIRDIRCDGAMPALSECEFNIACDVTNPLCGERGASAVYGPQKGATPEMVEYMDKWLSHFADLCSEKLGESFKDYPGAGAAGGLGFAFLTFLSGKLRAGIELVIEATSLEEKIKNADIIITGEGRLDGQSCMGKAPIGVARLAKKHGKAVIAFSGCVTDDARLTNEHGIDAFFPIVRRPCTLVDAMNEDTAYKNLADTAEQVFRIIKIMKI